MPVTRCRRRACRRCLPAVAQAQAPEPVVPGGPPTERRIAVRPRCRTHGDALARHRVEVRRFPPVPAPCPGACVGGAVSPRGWRRCAPDGRAHLPAGIAARGDTPRDRAVRRDPIARTSRGCVGRAASLRTADDLVVRIAFETLDGPPCAPATRAAMGRDDGIDPTVPQGGVDPAHPVNPVSGDPGRRKPGGVSECGGTFLEALRPFAVTPVRAVHQSGTGSAGGLLCSGKRPAILCSRMSHAVRSAATARRWRRRGRRWRTSAAARRAGCSGSRARGRRRRRYGRDGCRCAARSPRAPAGTASR